MNYTDINKYLLELKNKWRRRNNPFYIKIVMNKCERNEENRKLETDHRNIHCGQDASVGAKVSGIGTGYFHNLKVSSPNIH